MKLMIASDIHGSAFYCEKLIRAYEAEKADRLLLLGDLLYHGPRNALPEEYDPKSVAVMLNGLKNEILCVRGNCDAEVDQLMLEFPIMAEYCLIVTGSLTIYATHGHKLPESLKAGDILLYGHTHIPACEKQEDIVYLNPGSVAIPKENSWHGYMMLENDRFFWKDLSGNINNDFSMTD
jgi:putative phosphoesterase